MRRAAFALLGTAIGTSLLVGGKLGTHSPAAAQGVAFDAGNGVAAGPGVPADADDADEGPEDLATASTAASVNGTANTTAPGRPKTTTRPASPTKTTAAPKPPTTGGLKSGTFAGAPSTNEYGTIKVTITVSGGRITDVAAGYPTSPSRTASINSRAIPTLRQEALTAQSAKIDTVSGATYTSASYKISLQSALDRARA
jgi:uncharacterized protein with FMN-binding domain